MPEPPGQQVLAEQQDARARAEVEAQKGRPLADQGRALKQRGQQVDGLRQVKQHLQGEAVVQEQPAQRVLSFEGEAAAAAAHETTTQARDFRKGNLLARAVGIDVGVGVLEAQAGQCGGIGRALRPGERRDATDEAPRQVGPGRKDRPPGRLAFEQPHGEPGKARPLLRPVPHVRRLYNA